jgi:hypothetical protein
MFFTMRTLPPWEETEQWLAWNSTLGYRLWMRRISGEYVSPDKVTWLGEWMRAAKPGDVVYLNDEHESCPRELADVSIECDV